MSRLLASAVTALFACSTIYVGIAGAQTAPATSEVAGAPAASTPQLRLYRGSQIIGSTVRDAQGRKIGRIRDLILDNRRGGIAYAAVGFGGVTADGGRYSPVPWKALEPSDDGSYYTLRADRETISQAPGFDRKQWPNPADQAWAAEVERYWGRMVGRGMADTNRLPPTGAPGSNEASGSSGR